MNRLMGLAIVAAAATLGDAIWYTYGVRHTIPAGLVYGALLLTTVGAVIGARSGHVLKGLPIGTIAGLGGATSYYLLVVLMDRRTYGTAIPAAWIIMWFLLAALDGRWLRAPQRRTWAAVAARGTAAAITSGLAFYLVLTTLWGRPPASGRNYLVQFLAWAFAWAPGLFALTAGRERRAIVLAQTAPGTTLPASPAVNDSERSMTGAELLARIDRGETLRILDVRSEAEFAAGHVPGAVNIPFNAVPSRVNEVPGSEAEELVLYCGHGPRAYIAAAALRHKGWSRIVYLRGHWAAWQGAGLRVEH